MKKVLLALFAVSVFAGVSFAQASPIKLSLIGDIAVPNTQDVRGLGLGIVSMTDNVVGLQWDWIFSSIGTMQGVQVGLVSHSRDFTGVQWSFVNFNNRAQGVMLGAVNYAEDMRILQWGFVNYARNMNGLQLGFINYAENMRGVQIGLVNIIRNSRLPVMVIANARL
ncbi:MAG: hypothetical protein FWC85_00135 [Elusimicrobia bacterium]|nr:hypothetical protein [Elusimicrobiota bacterium]